MSDILPKITVGEIQRPTALRQRAEETVQTWGENKTGK